MTLAGRAAQIADVMGCVGEAVAGRASTLLVRGEPGVGKTSLVAEACRVAADRLDTVWAACLPLTSMTIPLLPLRDALRRAGLRDGATVVEFDAWLDDATTKRPLALVVDDLQWADQSSLDVLLYVIAGRPDRGLAVMATVRAGAEDDRLAGWLADVQRLPRVTELVLDRLDRAGTGEQIAGILGRPADEGLVDDVFARTGGNPYLTSLLVRGVDPRATVLPAARPARLRDAVIRPWREMSPPARELAWIVAVGGHPQAFERLTRIAPALGFAAPLLPALREAVDAHVLAAAPDGRYWFTHPLLAEVLEGELLPEQRRHLNGRYAAVLDDGNPSAAPDLADHYHRAGMAESAFRWALRAAGTAAGAAERLSLLRRALSLWPDLERPELSRADLWNRMRDAAADAGLGREELEAIEALIELIPAGREPLSRARLIWSRERLRHWLGIDRPSVPVLRATLAVTAAYPGSAEHALITAMLADELLTAGDAGGAPLAAAALDLAENSGDELAVAEALVVTAYAKMADRRPGVQQDAARAWEIASRLRHFTTFRLAVYVTANTHPSPSTRNIAAVFGRGADELAAAGAAHSHVAEMRAWEARSLLWAGEWTACERRLRVALGARPGPRGDVVARLTAAWLACLQGRQAEAEGHLARAEEIFAPDAGAPQFVYFDETRARVALEAGDPQRARDIAVRDLDRQTYVEDMLPLAARALADQADVCRDTGRDPTPVLDAVADLRRRYPRTHADSWSSTPVDALQAWADAETARAFRDPAEPARWRAAADALRDAEQPWDEAYACWREAQAALRDRRTHRAAPEALRRAHRLASDLAARKLLTDLERLARSARVDLAPAEPLTAPPPDLPGLTRREREVLGYLLVGGSNSQIAKALVLSEKTIGVHISNMLRKTGTTNRVELAELARRSRNRKSEEYGGEV